LRRAVEAALLAADQRGYGQHAGEPVRGAYVDSGGHVPAAGTQCPALPDVVLPSRSRGPCDPLPGAAEKPAINVARWARAGRSSRRAGEAADFPDRVTGEPEDDRRPHRADAADACTADRPAKEFLAAVDRRARSQRKYPPPSEREGSHRPGSWRRSVP
jgi:hypothetical protein